MITIFFLFLTHICKTDQKRQNTAQNKIKVRSLWHRSLKVALRIGIHLLSETNGKNSGGDRCEETGEEGIEGKGTHEQHVHILDGSSQKREDDKRVNEFDTLGRLAFVVGEEGTDDLEESLVR